MAEVIKMPRLSDTMTEGVIAAWHKKVGDKVSKGDLLAEIETDKATMELESYKDGTVLHLAGPDGTKINVDELLLIVGNDGEDISGLIDGKGADNASAPKEEKKEEAPKSTNEKPAQSSGSSLDISKMDEVVLMPRLSDTMTEGVIAAWRKNVGDDVKKGDILAEIETDKATMELESYKDGKLLYQGAKDGETIQVKDLLCIIGADGTDVEAIVAAAKNMGSDEPSEAQPEKQEATESKEVKTETKQAQPAAQEVVNEGRIFASPLAKKIAEDKGIDLKYVKGSGDNGRIVKTDVENYQPSAQPAAAAQSQSAAIATAPVGQESFEDVPVSQMRKTIARRLTESKLQSPHVYLTASINMDAVVAARPKLNGDGKEFKISFNDIVIKAVAAALKKHPEVNSSWRGEFVRINHHVNIGVAVAVPDGLLVPVIRFADSKSLVQISAEVKDFAQKAKSKKLQPSDWEGSTFTISNLGMFGIEQFAPIINPPDGCILGVGAINQEPIVKDGQIVVGNVMKVTLSCDHRVVDGAAGGAFLKTLKDLLEEPLRILL